MIFKVRVGYVVACSMVCGACDTLQRISVDRASVTSEVAAVPLPAVRSRRQRSTDGIEYIVTVADPGAGGGVFYAEPHFAVNPRDPNQLALASIGVLPGRGWTVSAFWSEDAGRSWRVTALPQLGDLRCFGDPWVVWGAGETAYLVCLTQRLVPGEDDWDAAVLLYRSDDAGRVWREPLVAPDDDVRGSWDHPVARRAANGDVVIVGTRSRVGPDGFGIARYRPGAHRFEPLRSYLPPEQVNDNMGGVAAIGDGRLAFTYFTMRGDGPRPLYAVRVTADGEERVVVREHVTPWGFPMLASHVDQDAESSALYAVWLEEGAAGGLDVWLARSGDEGRTWTASVAVNDRAIAAFRAAPQVAVNEHGDVAVMWYDTRDAATPQSPQPCGDIYVRRLSARGTSLGVELRVTRHGRCPDAPDPGGVRGRWHAGGDYLGLEYRDDVADLVWAEPGPNGSRIRFARIRLSAGP